MKVGFFQFCPKQHSPLFNRDYIVSKLSEISADALDLIVLPELAFSGYLFNSREELLNSSQTKNDEFFLPLQKIANEKGFAIICGFAEKEDLSVSDGNQQYLFSAATIDSSHLSSAFFSIYNSAIAILPNQKPFIYRKSHLYDREKLFFTKGNLGFPLFEFKGVKIAILICFDHLFPEAARTVALKGATLICHPANLVLPKYCEITSLSRALENRVYWISANRYGTESLQLAHKEPQQNLPFDFGEEKSNVDDSSIELTFSGKSKIISPYGEVLAQGEEAADSIAIVEIDPQSCVDKTLGQRNNLFEDRLPYLYDLL